MTEVLIAYQTVPPAGYELVTASHKREWMDATHDRSAYRCLPLLIANQSGWVILSPSRVRARWNGGTDVDAVELQRWKPEPHPQVVAAAAAAVGAGTLAVTMVEDSPIPDYVFPASHFGSGIITWTLPYLFRTPPGYNLLVRGPANNVKDGVAPLEGVIETDWTPATFTMNWKITRLDTWVAFEKGEPLCMIVPQRRGDLEQFLPKVVPLTHNAELHEANAAWRESRDRFNTERAVDGTEAAEQGWERHYFQGRAPDGTVAPEHQTRLHLNPFT